MVLKRKKRYLLSKTLAIRTSTFLCKRNICLKSLTDIHNYPQSNHDIDFVPFLTIFI